MESRTELEANMFTKADKSFMKACGVKINGLHTRPAAAFDLDEPYIPDAVTDDDVADALVQAIQVVVRSMTPEARAELLNELK